MYISKNLLILKLVFLFLFFNNFLHLKNVKFLIVYLLNYQCEFESYIINIDDDAFIKIIRKFLFYVRKERKYNERFK